MGAFVISKVHEFLSDTIQGYFLCVCRVGGFGYINLQTLDPFIRYLLLFTINYVLFPYPMCARSTECAANRFTKHCQIIRLLNFVGNTSLEFSIKQV